jgi:hypothetical protein
MRVLSVGFVLLFLTAVLVAQAPAPKGVPAGASSHRPIGTLAQVMRGVLFPNSNLIFDVQQIDPAAPRKKTENGASGGASADFANVYTGWQVVENAALALNEAADMIAKAGRMCDNGKPAPTDREDYQRFAQGLRDASQKAYAAAQTKNQEKVSDVANDLADACANCHEVYRDKGDAKSPLRCTP